MAFEIPVQPYSGKIGETTMGVGDSAVKLGGGDSYPFHLFEGIMPNAPKIAMEGIHDKIPNSTLVVIDKAGHSSPLSKAPEVNQKIIDFLKN